MYIIGAYFLITVDTLGRKKRAAIGIAIAKGAAANAKTKTDNNKTDNNPAPQSNTDEAAKQVTPKVTTNPAAAQAPTKPHSKAPVKPRSQAPTKPPVPLSAKSKKILKSCVNRQKTVPFEPFRFKIPAGKPGLSYQESLELFCPKPKLVPVAVVQAPITRSSVQAALRKKLKADKKNAAAAVIRRKHRELIRKELKRVPKRWKLTANEQAITDWGCFPSEWTQFFLGFSYKKK